METETCNCHYLYKIRNYLKDNKLLYLSEYEGLVNARREGNEFSIEKHVKGLIYAQLSNQTVWSKILPHLPEIDKLFFNYNIEKIVSVQYTDFQSGIFRLKCGNISTKKQMEALNFNISQMQKIVTQYGSMDAFVTSASAYDIVKQISVSNSKNKFRQVGTALAWEYLRNVGVDGAKPDIHISRFLGAKRMGSSRRDEASPIEVCRQVEQLANETGLTQVSIDNIIWSFCANGFGEICTKQPKCNQCPISDSCKNRCGE